MDSTTAAMPVPDYGSALTGDIKGMRLGVPREYFAEGLQPGVEAAVRSAIGALRDQGAEVVDVSLPSTSYALATVLRHCAG